jgi:hypothetical protein
MGAFPGGTGVFTQKTLLVQAGDIIGGRTLTSSGYPVINDGGTVAFFATYTGGSGIFTQNSLIAKTGDTICGRALIGLGQPAINSGGDVAFAALFSDGSSAIILARPMVASPLSRRSFVANQATPLPDSGSHHDERVCSPSPIIQPTSLAD